MSDQVHNIFVDLTTTVSPTMTLIPTEELEFLMRTKYDYEKLSNYRHPRRVKRIKNERKL